MSKELSIVFVLVLVASGRLQADASYDIVLKGGHVIDPANSVDAVRDIGIVNSKVARVDTSIPARDAEQVIDVSGYYVTPGLIDIHAHLFYTFRTRTVRSVIPDDHSFSSGVTTFVDAGTSGADNFESFLKTLTQGPIPTRTRVLAFINVCREGMTAGENDPRTFDVARAVTIAKKYPEVVVGFKTAHYWTSRSYDELHQPWTSVDRVLEAGRMAGLPVMFDFFPRPPSNSFAARSYRELILDKMRPGDIHTHCFAAHIPSVREDGSVNPDVIEAQKRGVLFDVGHGAGSFVYKHAVPAIKQGYLPNTISTDLHGTNTRNGMVVNTLNVMSKFLNLGLSFSDVIQRSTANPARAINRPELGNLSVGSLADIAVFQVAKGKFGYVDTGGGKIIGDRKIVCAMTMFAGEVVFDPSGLSRPLWQDVPRDSEYWEPPRQGK